MVRLWDVTACPRHYATVVDLMLWTDVQELNYALLLLYGLRLCECIGLDKSDFAPPHLVVSPEVCTSHNLFAKHISRFRVMMLFSEPLHGCWKTCGTLWCLRTHSPVLVLTDSNT